MLYNPPYGVSDPNAPYINGDPSIGRAGSIPPAASIEYPQREIVNLITDAGIAPSNNDMHQLAKGVQSGQLNYGDDIGTVNQVSLLVLPPVTALRKGMQFITIFANDNTGPSVASVSGLPFIEIVHPVDRTPLNPLELRKGAIGCLAFDGTKFQLAWSNVVGSTPGTPGVPIYLTTPLDYYIGGPGASDNNDGTTIAVTTAPHGPFATLQKAMNTIANFNLNGFDITLHVADGNYAAVRLGRMAGSGSTKWIGNPATPQNCYLQGSAMSAIVGQNCGATHSFNGFRLAAAYAGGSPDPCCGANISGTGTQVAFYNIWWDQAATHLAVTQAAVVGLGAKQNINGSAIGGNPNMTAGYHIYCANGAIIQPDGGNLPQLTVNGSTGGGNGGGFAVCSTLAFFEAYYASISGGGNWSGQ
jgi:hypothetical protein